MSSKITPIYETSVTKLLYEFREKNPEGYKGIVAFFDEITPLLDPSAAEEKLHAPQLKTLLKMQIALAQVECGVTAVGMKARSGEQNLAKEFEEATDRVADRFGGYEKFFEVQNFISDGTLKESVERFEQEKAKKEPLVPHVENQASVEASSKPLSWQGYVSNRNQAAEIVRS